MLGRNLHGLHQHRRQRTLDRLADGTFRKREGRIGDGRIEEVRLGLVGEGHVLLAEAALLGQRHEVGASRQLVLGGLGFLERRE